MTLLQKMKRPLTILVEGNIGAGKTLFLERFQNLSQVQVLQEPVSKWRNVNGNNLLHLMYQDPVRWALTFQTYVQLTMTEQHTMCKEPVKLMERSIYSARYCFVENLRNTGKLQQSEFEVLSAWFEYLRCSPDINLESDLVVYLRTSPQVAFERLKKRNRGEEHLISFQYIKDLHDLHEAWLLNQCFPLPAPVVVIDADKDQRDLEKEFLDLKNFILNTHLRSELDNEVRNINMEGFRELFSLNGAKSMSSKDTLKETANGVTNKDDLKDHVIKEEMDAEAAEKAGSQT